MQVWSCTKKVCMTGGGESIQIDNDTKETASLTYRFCVSCVSCVCVCVRARVRVCMCARVVWFLCMV
jgi:hypothetical protein